MTKVLTLVEFTALWLGFVVFTLSYAWSTGGLIRGGWHRTEAGRMLMTLGGSCAWILTLGMFGLWWPNYPGRAGVRVVSYALLVFAAWWLVSLLWRAQRQRRRGEDTVHDQDFQAETRSVADHARRRTGEPSGG